MRHIFVEWDQRQPEARGALCASDTVKPSLSRNGGRRIALRLSVGSGNGRTGLIGCWISTSLSVRCGCPWRVPDSGRAYWAEAVAPTIEFSAGSIGGGADIPM